MPVRASRLLPRLRLLLAVAAGGAVAACADAPDDAPSGPPDLLRLDVDLPPRVERLAPTQRAAELRADWPAEPGSLGVHRVEHLPDGGLRLAPPDPARAFALDAERVLLLDAAPGERLRVTLELEPRASAGAAVDARATRSFGGVTSLTEPLAAGDELSGHAARVLLRGVRDRSRPLRASRATPRATALHALRADHRQLVVLLNAAGAGLRVSRVRVERVPLPEYVAAGGPRAHEPATASGAAPGASATPDAGAPSAHAGAAAAVDAPPHALPRRVRLERDERRALRLDPDTVLRWELPAHTRAWRFEAALGCAPRDPALGGGVELELRADGAVLLTHATPGSADFGVSAWTPLRAELPAGTRTLELHARFPEGDGPFAVLAHPRLRRAAARPSPNLLLVSLDTLRPDRLGAHGGPAPSARLDAFAAESLHFTRAYAPSSYTLPGHASLLSGQLPALHGARDLTDRFDAARTPSLATVLAEQGYVTAAFTGGGFLSTSFGFGAGFDRFAHNDPCWPVDTERGAQLLGLPDDGHYELELLRRSGVELLADWLADQPRGAPFFALVHTYATHNYAPDRRWLERAGLVDEHGAEIPFRHDAANAFHAGELERRDEVFAQFSAYYDASIGTADDFVGALLDALERADLADDTVVVITSDHGEELGEHDRFGHGRSLREGVTRVPLMVRVPGRAPARIDDTLSLADLAPWLLELLGREVDPRMRPPPALAPDRADPPARTTTLLDLAASSHDLWALREGDLKLVHDASADTWQLFDLASDEGEHRDVSAAHPDALAALRHKLEGYRALAAARAGDGEGALDPETRRQLAQLGYLDGGD